MRQFLFFCFSFIPLLAQAYDARIQGIYYNLKNGEAEVTYNIQDGFDYSGAVVIPSSVMYDGRTYPVTSIGDYAFSDCFSMTSICIPSGVTSIGEAAFGGCHGLTSINIPNSVTTIQSRAFGYCM